MSVQMSVHAISVGPIGTIRTFIRRLKHFGEKADGPNFRKWDPVDQLLTIRDLQTSLSVSRSTAYRFIRANNIPIVYVLGAPRIRATDVEKALFTKKAV